MSFEYLLLIMFLDGYKIKRYSKNTQWISLRYIEGVCWVPKVDKRNMSWL